MQELASNTVTLRMFARREPATAAVRPRLMPDEPAGLVSLATEREITNMTAFIGGLDSDNPAIRRTVLAAYNDRMRMFSDAVLGTQSVTLSSTSLFPDMKNAGIPTAVSLTDADRQMIDTRWASLYNMRDYRQANHPFFKVGDVWHNITVDQYRVGERIKFGTVEAAETIYETEIYGTSLQWSDYFSRFNDKWARADGMTAMQTKSANALASRAYLAITAASGIPTTAYDTVGANATEKDVNTLNASMLAIKAALYDATSTIGGTTVEEELNDTVPFYLLYNDHTATYRERIQAALSLKYALVQQSGSLALKELNHPIVPIGSPRITTGFWYMLVPQRKNVVAIHMDQTFFDVSDPRVAGISQGEIGWEYNRVVVDDVNALRKISVS